MARRSPQIILSASAIPDRVGLFRGIRRWLDRDPHLRVSVYPAIEHDAQARSLRCDGFITDKGRNTEQILAKARFPVVIVTDSADRDDQYTVAFDERAIGRLAADHFLDQGHWQFAYVAYAPAAVEKSWQAQREQGFAAGLKEAGRSHWTLHVNDLPIDPRSRHLLSHHDPVRQRAVGEFLKALPKPLAVFAGDDNLGVMVTEACATTGLNVPADVAVLGVNNDPVCELSGPQLSSVAVPSERLGFEAMATMSALLGGKRDIPQRTLLPPVGIVIRPSSDALQVRDAVVSKAMRYIREHPNEAVGVKELAAHVGMSRRSLERRFRDAIGRTPGEEVHRLREVLWRRLLADTDLSMSEIAQRCGFGTPAAFATAVRRTEGIAPTAFRQNAQGAKVSNSI